MIVSSLGKNSDSSGMSGILSLYSIYNAHLSIDIAPLNLNITFTDGEDGLRGTVISERFEHTIVMYGTLLLLFSLSLTSFQNP